MSSSHGAVVVTVGLLISLAAASGCVDVETPSLPVGCAEDTLQCPDGSFVGRHGPLCALADCPAATCDQLASFAEAKLEGSLSTSCAVDADCVSVPFNADCYDGCTRSGSKQGATQLDDMRQQVNGNQCKQFTAQRCTVTHPPCDAPAAPHCVEKVCQ